MEVKTDCYGYLKRKNTEICTAMKMLYCKKGECKFYTPLKEVCGNCTTKDCNNCLTVCHENQTVTSL